MNTTESTEDAIEALQQLGLKEYEARCFVGLTHLGTGTAKDLSDLTGIPRTRIYDVIRLLEAQGLVQIQHSSPQQFRAVPLDEATETLRDQYEDRVERLHDALDTTGVVGQDTETPIQQMWTMSGQNTIEEWVEEHISRVSEEIVLVIGDESLLTDSLIDSLNQVCIGVELLVGALTEPLREHIQTAVPDATTFTSGVEWLHGENATKDKAAIGRLMLVDRSTFLVSSIMPETKEELAIFSKGLGNGPIVIACQLMAQELLPQRNLIQ